MDPVPDPIFPVDIWLVVARQSDLRTLRCMMYYSPAIKAVVEQAWRERFQGIRFVRTPRGPLDWVGRFSYGWLSTLPRRSEVRVRDAAKHLEYVHDKFTTEDDDIDTMILDPAGSNFMPSLGNSRAREIFQDNDTLSIADASMILSMWDLTLSSVHSYQLALPELRAFAKAHPKEKYQCLVNPARLRLVLFNDHYKDWVRETELMQELFSLYIQPQKTG